VFVGSIEEARGREFPVVFLPGLAEGLFPQRALEDPLLLDDCRRELGDGLLLREDRTLEERERLQLACAAARDRRDAVRLSAAFSSSRSFRGT